jgi:hypothetical protein
MKPRIEKLLTSLRVLRFYIPHVTALAMALLAGVGIGFSTIFARPPTVDTADRWALPHWAAYHAGSKPNELSHMALWAEDPTKHKDDATAKPPAPPWRFIGTVQDGKRLLAMIELDQGKRVQRLGAGDPLPNGAPVKTINFGELTYMENDTETTLKLFGVAKDQNFPAPSKKK